MRAIKFSHVYDKFPEGYEVSRLLDIFVVERKSLHDGFVEYDTSYGKEGQNYPLPKGKVIILLLQTMDHGELWTTIRRYTPRKFEYYAGSRGSYVKCDVAK